MISFIPAEFSIKYYFLISILYTFVLLIFWKKNITKFDAPYKYQPLLIVFVLLHLIFAFDGGDFYNYYHGFIERNLEPIEAIYIFLGKQINYNYLLFRFIVWGAALSFVVLGAKRLGIDSNKVVYLLYLMFISVFDYGRVSLAMAIYFYGISFWCAPLKKNTLVSYVVGFCIIMSSLYFHRSMIFPILISFMVFVPLTKKTVFLLFAFLLVFGNILSFAFERLLGNLIFADQDTVEKVATVAQYEFNGASESISMYEWIRRYIEYTLLIFPVFYLLFKMKNNKHLKSNTIQMEKLLNLTIGLIFMAFAILVVKIGNFIVFYRYLYMAMIPTIYLIVYARSRLLINKKLFKFLIIVNILNKYFGISKILLGGNF